MQLTKSLGKLIAIGGAEDREGEMRILKKFIELAGGSEARIAVLTVATDHPEESKKEMTRVFKRLKVKSVRVYDVTTRADAEAKRGVKIVSEATGLYFTGGDQLHITSLMGGTEMQEVIYERFKKNDLVVAGTSAGAAMMGNSMILGGNGEEAPRLESVQIGPGMDFMIGALVDTHFSQRGRHGRLLAAVAHYPQDLGLGIDENTAMVIRNGDFEVIGEGSVTVFDGSDMVFSNASDVKTGSSLALSNVKVHVIPEGYKFNFKERCMVIPKNPKAAAKKAASVAAAASGNGRRSNGNKK